MKEKAILTHKKGSEILWEDYLYETDKEIEIEIDDKGILTFKIKDES